MVRKLACQVNNKSKQYKWKEGIPYTKQNKKVTVNQIIKQVKQGRKQ